MQDRETITLNIGLENNKLFGNATAQQIADTMRHFLLRDRIRTGYDEATAVGVQIVNPLEETSNATERTAVVEFAAADVSVPALKRALAGLADETTQEAIAVWIDHDAGRDASRGFLVGPKADAWGPFDVSKFEIGGANAGCWVFSREMQLGDLQ